VQYDVFLLWLNDMPRLSLKYYDRLCNESSYSYNDTLSAMKQISQIRKFFANVAPQSYERTRGRYIFVILMQHGLQLPYRMAVHDGYHYDWIFIRVGIALSESRVSVYLTDLRNAHICVYSISVDVYGLLEDELCW